MVLDNTMPMLLHSATVIAGSLIVRLWTKSTLMQILGGYAVAALAYRGWQHLGAPFDRFAFAVFLGPLMEMWRDGEIILDFVRDLIQAVVIPCGISFIVLHIRWKELWNRMARGAISLGLMPGQGNGIFRFTIRGLLVLIVFAAIGFWFAGPRVRNSFQEQLLIDRVKTLHGEVLQGLNGIRGICVININAASHKQLRSAIEVLPTVDEVRNVVLTNTSINDSDVVVLSQCKELYNLVLRGTEVTDASVPYLARLKSLRSLDITDTAITEVGCAKLRQELPETKVTWTNLGEGRGGNGDKE